MNGAGFIRRVRQIGKERGVDVRFERRQGKGSHERLYYGNRYTTVKDRKQRTGQGAAARHDSTASLETGGFLTAMRYVYPVKLIRQREGGYLVRFPDLPEALTEGETREQALAEAQDALVAALGGYVQARRMIPAPSRIKDGQHLVYLPPLIAAKLALYQAMREQRINNVALAKRLGVSETAVRRLVHPDHASRIEKVEEAMAVLGKRLIVEAA